MLMLIKIKVFFHMFIWDCKNFNKWTKGKGKMKARQREKSRYFNIVKNQAICAVMKNE